MTPTDLAALAEKIQPPHKVLLTIERTMCRVDWMRDRLPAKAIPVADRLPPYNEEALGWLSTPSVSIYFAEAVVWRTRGVGEDDEWWSGLPGSYLDLRRLRWNLSHWLPIAALRARSAS